MSTVTFQFTLPEEQDEARRVQMVDSYCGALHDFYQWARGRSKHGGDAVDAQAAYTEAYSEFMRTCSEYGFDPLTGLLP